MAEGLMKLIHGQPEYDGRFIMVGPDLPRPINRPTGSYDRTILCRKCDNQLGSLDEVAIQFCKRTDLKPHPSGAAFTITGVDAKKLKLFALSYVWRASITNLDEYKGVSLGVHHEEMIRNMLIENNSGGADDYSVLISKFKLPADKEKWGMHVLNPVANRMDGINLVDVYLPNLYKLKVKVDRRPFTQGMGRMGLGATDEILVLDMGEYTASQEFSIMHRAIMNTRSQS